MYKFAFTMLTDSLELPISSLGEYVILAIIYLIAFRIAWNVSPGGTWGAEIHWVIRAFVVMILWYITNTIIIGIKWLRANWMLVIFSILGIVFFTVGIIAVILAIQKCLKLRH